MSLLDVPDLPDDLAFLFDEVDDDPGAIEAAIARMHPQDRARLVEAIERFVPPPPPWEPLPHQIPPSLDDAWYGWLLLGGRGIGKTAAVTRYMDDHVHGPACLPGKVPHRMGIIAPTLGDASASIVHGVDGLMVINPQIREVTRKGGTVVLWPNGSEAKLFGTHSDRDVDRLRAGGNRCFDIREEVAAWPKLKDGIEQADFGLRLGIARWIGATTPRPRPSIRKLNDDPIVVVTHARTADNPHLPAEQRERLYEMYGNTRIGLQELEGQILEEVSGALWSQELIEQHRVSSAQVPKLRRVRTYVDPSWGTTNDECGIVVVGLGEDKHIYVLADLSKRTTPAEWGLLAALGWLPPKDVRPADAPFAEFFGRRSERVVYETNFQGEQVKLVMRATAREIGRRILTSPVVASKGKRVRAEPVHMMYERGRVHHVGYLPGLEFQMVNWTPPEVAGDAGDPGDPAPADEVEGMAESSTWSPDRLDALVFGVTDLAFSATGLNWRNPAGQTTREQPVEVIGDVETVEADTGRIPDSVGRSDVPASRVPRPSRIPTRSVTPRR
jgi:phage terminase large subunit-like protein